MESLRINNHKYITKDKGIYMIWSKIKPDMYYFGSSKNIRKRFNEHYGMLNRRKHSNNKLQNHVNKYGLDDLEFCVHIINNNLSLDELRDLEAHEIKYYNSYEKGFNLTDNTKHPGCLKMSEAQKRNLSIKATIRQSSQEYRDALALKYRGTKSISAKLTKEDIEYVRKNAIIKGIKCMNIRILAKELNVCTTTIQRVLRGRTYKND